MRDRASRVRGLARVSHLFLSGPEQERESVTIQAAANMLEVSKGAVITYLNNGLLTRIKDVGRVYIPIDEVKALHTRMKEADVTTVTGTSGERVTKRPVFTAERGSSEHHLTPSGQPENEPKYPPEYLRKTNRELESLKSEFNTLKQNLDTRASELEEIKIELKELEEKQRSRLADCESRAHALYQDISEKTRARLLLIEEQLKRLGQPWWKQSFAHLGPSPQRSRQKGVLLSGCIAVVAVLLLSWWWLNLPPKPPPVSVTERQASLPEKFRATSQTPPDSQPAQEEPPEVVQQLSERLPTTAAPMTEPVSSNAKASQPYSFPGSPSLEEETSPAPAADPQFVGLFSPVPPYILSIETLATTWLHLIIDDREKLEYLLQPNEKYTWKAETGFRLHIGNAAGLKLYLNDQPIKLLGKSGEVVHLQLPEPSPIVTSNSEHTDVESGE